MLFDKKISSPRFFRGSFVPLHSTVESVIGQKCEKIIKIAKICNLKMK